MLLSNSFQADVRVLKEAESLVERGHRVTVVAWDRQAELAAQEQLPNGVAVERVQDVPSAYGVGMAQLARVPRFWLRALRHLRRLKPDIIHCHDFDTLPAGLWYGFWHRRPVIYDAHEYYADLCRPRLHGRLGDLVYHLIRFAEAVGTRFAKAVITVDENLGAIFRRRNRRVLIVGHYPRRATVGPANPVFSRPEIKLLYVGRLSASRGSLVYVDLLRALLAQGLPARLVLAGSFTPAAEKDALLQAAVGLEEHLDILGVVPNQQVPALLQAADVGLALLQPLPRFEVALPVKLFEYMAAGLPVLVSNFPPIAALYEHFPFGALLDPTDAVAAARQVAAWAAAPAEAQAAGETGRSAIQNELNWEKLIDQIDRLYRELTA